jgi:ferritin
MKTNKLSKALTAELNEQMTKEAQASQTFLSYASWAEDQGFDGIANVLSRHAEEAHKHMMKILEYILKRGEEVHLTSILSPPGNPENINNCFEKVFEHEIENTKLFHKIVKMSFDEEDKDTMNFIRSFVKEQIEEETLAINFSGKTKIADCENGSCKVSYSLDKDPENTPDSAILAQYVLAVNP